MATADRISARREQLGMTQRELAVRSRLPLTAIHHYERGVTTPTAEELARLATALGVEPEDLVEETPTQ
jgi:transcriptional regulator with XRE-family HTH domain